MHCQSTLMSSKCDTLRAAFGMDSSGTSTHLNPAGAAPGVLPLNVDGVVTTRTLVSDSAADTPFLMAEESTQYVSAIPMAAAMNGSSNVNATTFSIPESPSGFEASILADAACPPPATKGAVRAVAAPAAPALGAGTLRANLDLNDKLVKRGLSVSWHGLPARVGRVRMGRCLLVFSDGGHDVWCPCSAVQVVKP